MAILQESDRERISQWCVKMLSLSPEEATPMAHALLDIGLRRLHKLDPVLYEEVDGALFYVLTGVKRNRGRGRK
jgi:hypothetical protein